MAWTYEQNFDSLNNGTLGGQDSWYGTDADQRVQDSVAFGGSGKAVIMDGTVQTPTSYRNITAVTSGTVYFAIRWGVNGGGGDSCRFLLSDGTNRAVNIKGIDDGGTMKWYQKTGSSWVYWFTPTQNTWYIIRVDFDSSTDTYDCNYKVEGGSWNTAVTGQNYDQASGDISRIAFTNDTGNTTYFDEISPTDPDVGATSVKIEKSLKYCIKTTPSAVTKSLKYVVKTTPSAITKSLTYAVTKQTAIQKSLEYQIKATPSAITKSLTYAISDLNYTREAKDTLPTDNANLATSYSSADITDVETDDGVRVSIDGIDSQYLIHQFKTAHENATDDIRVSWNGQVIVPCSVKAVYLQVYNHTSGLWETIDGDNTTAKDTDFDLEKLIDSDHANYYNGVYNEVSFRVYQVA